MFLFGHILKMFSSLGHLLYNILGICTLGLIHVIYNLDYDFVTQVNLSLMWGIHIQYINLDSLIEIHL